MNWFWYKGQGVGWGGGGRKKWVKNPLIVASLVTYCFTPQFPCSLDF